MIAVVSSHAIKVCFATPDFPLFPEQTRTIKLMANSVYHHALNQWRKVNYKFLVKMVKLFYFCQVLVHGYITVFMFNQFILSSRYALQLEPTENLPGPLS